MEANKKRKDGAPSQSVIHFHLLIGLYSIPAYVPMLEGTYYYTSIIHKMLTSWTRESGASSYCLIPQCAHLQIMIN